jgi:hypothetical protein
MRPRNEVLVQVLREGFAESQMVGITNQIADGGQPREFANRMTMRLSWAIARIQELERAAETV